MRAWVEVPASAGDTEVIALMEVDDYIALDGRRLSIGSHGYVQMWNRPGMMLLHRWLMGIPVGVGYRILVDHINHDVLDYRRHNLRLLSPTASNMNRTVSGRDLPLGVHRSRSGRFYAKFKRQRKQVHLGTFDTIEDAEKAVITATAAIDRALGIDGLRPAKRTG